MGRTGDVIHRTKRVRAAHRAYRRNAAQGPAESSSLSAITANLSAKAVHSTDMLFDVVDAVADALIAGLLPATPTVAQFTNSVARLESSGRYEALVRHLRHIQLGNEVSESIIAKQLASVAEEAAELYRDVIQKTRGMKPRKLKDSLRDEAERVFKSRLSALDCMSVVAGRRAPDLAVHFTRVATVALERTKR